MSKARLLIWFITAWIGIAEIAAQEVAVKTDLLYDATTTPNIGMEFGMGQHWTMQVFYGLNPWTFSEDRKVRHWVVMPEVRYWLCSTFNGHFFGLHAMGGEFNLEGIRLPNYLMPFGTLTDLKDHHYEGWYAGGGLTYGYQWILGRHWNIEASIGLGGAYLDYSKYKCKECGFEEDPGHKVYFGLTKEVISLLYIF
ncbi:MAG: DUF3575 domain-containing protein [Paludibacteraceae bacterium]|nr:DUF3575 domain-containing protein [Paludibacteraceae bacterium]